MAENYIVYTRLEQGKVLENILVDVDNPNLQRYPDYVEPTQRNVLELRKTRNGYRALTIGHLINQDGNLTPAVLVMEDSSEKFGQNPRLIGEFSGTRISEASLDSPFQRLLNLRRGNATRFRLITTQSNSAPKKIG